MVTTWIIILGWSQYKTSQKVIYTIEILEKCFKPLQVGFASSETTKNRYIFRFYSKNSRQKKFMWELLSITSLNYVM